MNGVLKIIPPQFTPSAELNGVVSLSSNDASHTHYFTHSKF